MSPLNERGEVTGRLKHHFARKFFPLVLLITLFIAGAIPYTYYSLAHTDLENQAKMHSLQVARQVQQIIQNNPRFWKYDSHPYHMLDRNFGGVFGAKQIVVYDERGELVHRLEESPAHDLITASSPFTFNSRVMGEVRVGMSKTLILEHTHLLIVISIVGAASAGALLFLWPVRIIERSERAFIHQVREKVEAQAAAKLADQRSSFIQTAHAELERAHRHTLELLEQLRQREVEIAKKNYDLETILYSVSHDLKGPVVALQALVRALLDDRASSVSVAPAGGQGETYEQRCLQCIRENASLVENMLSDLLEFSRIGHMPLSVEEVSLDSVVAEIVERCRIQFRGDVEVRIPELPRLQTDPFRIRQVFENLLANSFKFMGDTAAPSIEIGVESTSIGYTFWVKDNGRGIEPAHHEAAFELFQRFGAGEIDGTGVGLAIVKRVIESISGRIWIDSETGKGTTIYFTWPATPATAEVPDRT